MICNICRLAIEVKSMVSVVVHETGGRELRMLVCNRCGVAVREYLEGLNESGIGMEEQ
jgi:hypothetical protein